MQNFWSDFISHIKKIMCDIAKKNKQKHNHTAYTGKNLPLCRNGFGDVIGTVNLDWNRGLEGTEWEPENVGQIDTESENVGQTDTEPENVGQIYTEPENVSQIHTDSKNVGQTYRQHTMNKIS